MSWKIHLYIVCDCKNISVDEGENFTHNCNGMIREAGFEGWNMDDLMELTAGELRDKLMPVIRELEDNPEKYTEMNPPNGWGSYLTLLPVLQRLLGRCIDYPSAKVYASF